MKISEAISSIGLDNDQIFTQFYPRYGIIITSAMKVLLISESEVMICFKIEELYLFSSYEKISEEGVFQ